MLHMSSPSIISLDAEETAADARSPGKPDDLHVSTNDGHIVTIESELVQHLELLTVAHCSSARDDDDVSTPSAAFAVIPLDVCQSDLELIIGITAAYIHTNRHQEQSWRSSIANTQSHLSSLQDQQQSLQRKLVCIRHKYSVITSRIRIHSNNAQASVDELDTLLAEQSSLDSSESALLDQLRQLSMQTKTLRDKLHSLTFDAEHLAHNVYLPGVSSPIQMTHTTKCTDPSDTSLARQLHPSMSHSTVSLMWREDVFQLRQLLFIESYLGFPWLRRVLSEKLIVQLGVTFREWFESSVSNDSDMWAFPQSQLSHPVDLDPVIRFCGITTGTSFRRLKFVPHPSTILPASSQDAPVLIRARDNVVTMLHCSTGMDKRMFVTLVDDRRFPVVEISALFECALLQGFSVTGSHTKDNHWITQEPYLSWTLDVFKRTRLSDRVSVGGMFQRLLPTYRELLWASPLRDQLASSFGITDSTHLVAFKEAQSLKHFFAWKNRF